MKAGKTAICHISFSEFPSDGRVKRYVNALIKEGYFVCVICKSDPYHMKTESGVNLFIRRLNVQKKRGNYISRTFEYVFFFKKAAFFALIYFFKYKVRLYHTHTLPDFVSMTALVPRLLGAKVILDLHEFTPEILMLRRNIPETNWLTRLSYFIEKLSIKCADELITIHEGVVKLIGGRNKRKMTEIINGVEEGEFGDFAKVKTQNFNLVYNGTINDTINLEEAVYALAYLLGGMPAEEFDKIKLNIYGSGPALEFVMGEVKKNNLEETVIYHGKVPFKTMIEELQKMDACILPLHKIFATDMSFPIKVPEMVNLGIPIIISRLDTMQKYFPEKCFFYFEAGDHRSLAEQIMLVKNNGTLADEKSLSAKNAYEKISWEKVMKPRYLELVNKTLS